MFVILGESKRSMLKGFKIQKISIVSLNKIFYIAWELKYSIRSNLNQNYQSNYNYFTKILSLNFNYFSKII